MKFDEMFEKTGGIGTYQKRVFLLLGLPSMSVGSFCFMTIVILFTPDHRCKVPGLDNDTYTVQGKIHQYFINQSIPLSDDPTLFYDRCQVYDVYNDNLHDVSWHGNASLRRCQEWVYDKSVFSETFTSKANLVCEDSLKTSHIQMFFYFGLLVGDFVFGLLADLIGRKKTMCLSLILLLISSSCVTFVPEFYSFGIMEFIIGGCAHGTFVCIAVLCVEIVGPSQRVMMSMFMQIFSAFGVIYLSGVAYLARDWKWINLACAIPCVFYLSYWWLISESPRWLLSKGRYLETEIIIEKVATTNKVQVPVNMLDTNTKKTVHESGNILDVFKSPILLRRTLILCFAWTIISMTFYGVTMNAGNLGGSFYLNFMLMGVAELPGYIMTLLLLDRVGRRWCNGGFLILGGVACIATVPTVLLASKDLQPLTVLLALIGKAGASGAFGVIFIYTGELLPTVVRNAAMGCCSCAARVGSMLAPYIAKSGEMIGGKFGQVEPLVVFGVLSIIAGGMLFLLPETLNEQLPDTIKDGEQFGRQKKTQHEKPADKHAETPFI